MANNSAKLLQWKAGEEKECKGFYWSTKLAVQQAWEQHTVTEDVHGYRTFKSTIHCQMIPIVCAELMINRAQFDAMPDAELIDRIDKRLKPTGPVDYLIKLRAIKFSHDGKDTLLHRYRAFAEPFLQLISEAHDAGCAINEESIKLAFREACRPNNLMMMWLHEQRWQDATNAHHQIMQNMRQFDTLTTLQSLNGAQPAQLPAQAGQHQNLQAPAAPIPQQQQQQSFQPARPAPHNQQQQPYYSRDQRAEFKRQRIEPHQPSHLPEAPQAQHTPAFAPTPPSARLNPLFQPAQQQAPQQPQMNVTVPSAAPQQGPYVQPGLDQRGANWHPIGAKCKFTPCSSPFCQGCGEHGHSAHECKKRGKHANWNYSGYYAEQRPGQAALVYDGPARLPNQFSPPQQASPAQSFPTPHVIRPAPPPPTAAAHVTRNYTPVSRSNATTQHGDSSGNAAPQ
jgi:hypothetical protein